MNSPQHLRARGSPLRDPSRLTAAASEREFALMSPEDKERVKHAMRQSPQGFPSPAQAAATAAGVEQQLPQTASSTDGLLLGALLTVGAAIAGYYVYRHVIPVIPQNLPAPQ